MNVNEPSATSGTPGAVKSVSIVSRTNSEYQRFESLARKIAGVPKSEVDKLRRQERKDG